jgi:acetyl-CoA acetyltransferase
MPLAGHEVVIVDAVRTGLGRGHPVKGQYREVSANVLLGSCYEALLSRTGLAPELVDDVIAGSRSRRRPSTGSAAPASRPSTSPLRRSPAALPI